MTDALEVPSVNSTEQLNGWTFCANPGPSQTQQATPHTSNRSHEPVSSSTSSHPRSTRARSSAANPANERVRMQRERAVQEKGSHLDSVIVHRRVHVLQWR